MNYTNAGWHYRSRETQDGIVYDVYYGDELVSSGWSLRMATNIVAEH